MRFDITCIDLILRNGEASEYTVKYWKSLFARTLGQNIPCLAMMIDTRSLKLKFCQ